MTVGRRSESQMPRLIATFAEADGQVRANIVVRFPPAAGIGPQRTSSLHADMAAAVAWVKGEAKRRCIEWEPDSPVGTDS
jgi:hypothetical protein